MMMMLSHGVMCEKVTEDNVLSHPIPITTPITTPITQTPHIYQAARMQTSLPPARVAVIAPRFMEPEDFVREGWDPYNGGSNGTLWWNGTFVQVGVSAGEWGSE